MRSIRASFAGAHVASIVSSPWQPPRHPIAAGSLVGAYVVARETGVRPLGGVVLVGAGAYLSWRWTREGGPRLAGVLLGTYLAGFGLSHPLAKRIGAWPSVLSAAAVSAAASHLLADRPLFVALISARHPALRNRVRYSTVSTTS